ncbi:hypothetical protein RI444_20690 [Paenarthrobacter sp. AT5]|uniref:hypothetical protein n=1 Tax=Paenarthrobacter TaxID=1742992 RepID=UPI001F609C20|nr:MULTISPECIES: hypothetical protein [Paenarthrobacter]WOC60882.1 hypothetical protein RI444_20690 [Paenarthrobacter sp. AT5]
METAARREVIEDDEAMDSVLPKNAQKFMAHTVAYSPIWTVNRPPRPVPQSVVDAGCGVAWPSSEGYSFVDPPCLFLAEDMSGSVFAALTSAGEFFCPLDPDQPIRAISDDHLALCMNMRDGGGATGKAVNGAKLGARLEPFPKQANWRRT